MEPLLLHPLIYFIYLFVFCVFFLPSSLSVVGTFSFQLCFPLKGCLLNRMMTINTHSKSTLGFPSTRCSGPGDLRPFRNVSFFRVRTFAYAGHTTQLSTMSTLFLFSLNFYNSLGSDLEFTAALLPSSHIYIYCESQSSPGKQNQ